MIKFRYTLEKEKIECLIPEGWHEVKMKHLLRLEKEQPTLNHHALACFTDTPLNDFLNSYSKDDIEAISQIFTFLNDKPSWKRLKKKKRIQLGDKLIKPPENIRMKTIGQKSIALPIVMKYAEKKEEEITPEIDDVLQILAIYFQPEYSGKYDDNKIPGIKQLILEANCIDVMPWFIFFFRKLLRGNLPGLIDLRVSKKTLKNLAYIKGRAASSLTNSRI